VTLPWAESLADSSPLRLRIEAEVTPALLERIAAAHKQGRRLYVGTTDLDAKNLVVWDVGAIAAGDNPDKLALVRKVILASASVPGLLPPVPIDVVIDGKPYTELHVDWRRQRQPVPATRKHARPEAAARRDRRCGRDGVGDRGGQAAAEAEGGEAEPVADRGRSLEGVLQSAFEGDLIRIYLMSRNWGCGSPWRRFRRISRANWTR